MSADRFPGATLPLLYVIAVLLLSAVGTVWVLRWEKAHPSSYPAQEAALEAAGVASLDGWLALPTDDQEAADTASLDEAEQAELDAVDGARESAAELVARAQINAQFHP
jgi:hypothetical protein